MSKTRLELKVGIFVAIGLALLAILMIQFSKGGSLFRQTYELQLRAGNVGGLKPNASVLLAGVPVGIVSDIQLGPGGTNVLISLQILKKHPIHADARFVIEQSGFLGDQYVAIIPTKNEARLLQDGDEVRCEEPFNLQEVARGAAGFLQRVDQTARDLNAAIADIRRLTLNEQTLTNFSEAVGALRTASDEAQQAMGRVNSLVESNREPFSLAVSNLVLFSDRLNSLATSANTVLDTNAPSLNESVENIRQSTESLKALLAKAESGDGLAGALLSDQSLARDVSQIASNLSVTTSNLNRRGLWGILWGHKPPKTNNPPEYKVLRSPGDPFK